MPRTKKTTPASNKSMQPELGSSGTTNFQGAIDTGEYVAKLRGSQLYTTVDKMRWSDASVKAALLLCELPLRSTEWSIEAASDSTENKEIADFIKKCMFNKMTVGWDDTLRQILLMHPYGCIAMEVVYWLMEDGKIGWRKWAPRLPKTITYWNVDDAGELESITQQCYKKIKGSESFVTIDIPAEKLMVFTYQKEGDNYLGTSILRQAYKHWFFRDKYYKIDAVAQERLGIGIPVCGLPEGFSPKDKTDAETMCENLRGHEKAYVVKKKDWDLEMLDMKNGSMRDPMPMLEHHTREILKSVLAQFLDLGSSSVGSFALQSDQSGMFLNAIDSSAKIVEDVINKEIKKLVDYNYNVEDYPKLTHGDLGTKDFSILASAIQTLCFSNIITADDSLEDYMRSIMKLPERDESKISVREQAQFNKENMDKRIAQQAVDKKTTNKADKVKESKKEKPEEKQEDENKPTTKGSEYFREFTTAEKRVKFNEIEDYMDSMEINIITKLKMILAQERPDMMARFEAAIRTNNFSDLQRINWKLTSKYAHVFKEEMKKLFEWGKLKSSYEIKVPSPATPYGVNDTIKRKASELAKFHEDTMLESMKGVAAVAMMDKNVSTQETISKLTKAFDFFETKNLPASASLVVTENVNDGRKYTFDSNQDEVHGYQWSAILDGAVCNYCASMDGRVIGTKDKAFSEYRPGSVHFHCRCIWVAVMKDEVDPPPYTGIPAVLNSQAEVPPWEFKDIDVPLPGSGKRAMPYGVGVFKEEK